MKVIIAEFPNISIDNFETENNYDSSTCFFLTHCHSDHTKGLEQLVPFLKENRYYIYCSPISGLILLNSNYGLQKDMIREVEGTMLIQVPGSKEYPVSYYVTVTAIPAGHSPGSIMFLLQDCKKTILFTGDFRILKEDLQKFKQLKSYMACDETFQPKVIDTIYIDLTFYSKQYFKFLERKVYTEIGIDLIRKKFKDNPDYHVDIMTGAQGGYENFFLELAREFKCKIHVDDDYFRKFSLIAGIGNIFTKDCGLTRFHYCQGSSHKRNVKIPEPFYQVKLCALRFFWKQSVTPQKKLFRDHSTRKLRHRYYVFYPTHSSYSEVKHLLCSLQHKQVRSISGEPNVVVIQVKFYESFPGNWFV